MEDLVKILQKQMKDSITSVDIQKLLQNKTMLVTEVEKMLTNVSVPEEVKTILRKTLKQL